MTRRIYVVLALVWGLLVGMFGHAIASQDSISHGKSVYELWRTWDMAPLSIVFRHHCITAEDSSAHLILVDYSKSRVVFSCDHTGF